MAAALQQERRRRLVLQPKQNAFATCPVEQVFYGGARGGGKGYGMIGDWCLHQALHKGNARGLFIRRTYGELEQFEHDTNQFFPHMGARFTVTRPPRTWTFRNGATLRLAYMKRDADAEQFQGNSYTRIYSDEAGNFAQPTGIDALSATLRSAAGVPVGLRLAANPGGVGHSWIKKRFIDPAPPMTPFYDATHKVWRVFIPSGIDDNPALLKADPDYKRRLNASGPAWLVRAWLAGDWNASAEGGIIHPLWFRRYTRPPARPRRRLLSIDAGNKTAKKNDPTAMGIWFETRIGWYLVDVVVDRFAFPSLRRATESLAERYKPHAVLIEDKANGTPLIQELKGKTTLPVFGIEPRGSKAERLNEVSPLFESGRVFLPESAAWLTDYENELTIFPLAGHDDQVDMTSQALIWATEQSSEFDYAAGPTREQIAAAPVNISRGWGTISRR